jgi:hypothetical protein
LNATVKLGIAAVVVGLLFVAARAVGLNDLANKLQYKIVGFGKHSFSGSVLSVPLTARLVNNTNEQVSIDSLRIALSLWKVDRYVLAGWSDITQINIMPGTIDKSFVASADLKAIAQDALNTITNILATRLVKIKVDITPTIAGVQLPPQTIIKDVQL